MKKIKLFAFVLVLFSLNFACKRNETIQKTDNKIVTQQVFNPSISIKVKNHDKIKAGGKIMFISSIVDSSKFDSIVFYFNDKRLFATDKKSIDTFFVDTDGKLGKRTLKATVFSGKQSKSVSAIVTIFAAQAPNAKTYSVVRKYPHDRGAYTQGLVYYDGFLYESTGLETLSTLRKEDLQTNKVLLSITLPNNYFGEGISILNDKIYMITWQSHIGLVYSLSDFTQLMTFSYEGEGWGLTTDGNVLFMSDGTNIIRVLDPQTFYEIEKIQVYDDKRQVNLLNELEYIDGLIYANVYTKDYIVTIDPQTGKVVDKIDFAGILPASLRRKDTDVLNGIAYDEKKHRIFVTGKNWPQLYEVKIIDK